MDRLNLSVALIVYNEEERLGRTLESIKDIASEIIIIDSNSTDNTCAVAESFGAKIYNEEWRGFVEQKNSLTAKCSKDYILYLDADEVVGDELKKSIIAAVTNGSSAGYYIRRKTHYLGRLLNYSWQKDERLRLVKADASPLWVGEIVHEELKVDGNTSHLNGYLIHYSYRDIDDHFRRTIRYARLSAESYYKRGKKFKLSKMIFSPFIAFMKIYIVKGGFLDGIPGFIAGVSAYVYGFLKYAFLWDMYRVNKGRESTK